MSKSKNIFRYVQEPFIGNSVQRAHGKMFNKSFLYNESP